MFPEVRLARASRVPAGSGLSEFLHQTEGDLSAGERWSTERTEGNVKPESRGNELGTYL